MRKLKFKKAQLTHPVTLPVSGRGGIWIQNHLSLLVMHWLLWRKWLGMSLLLKLHLPVLQNPSISSRTKDGIWVGKVLIVPSECGQSLSALIGKALSSWVSPIPPLFVHILLRILSGPVLKLKKWLEWKAKSHRRHLLLSCLLQSLKQSSGYEVFTFLVIL